MGESKHCFRGWLLIGLSLIYSVTLSLYTSEFVYGLGRFSRVRLFVAPWTIPLQAFLSMGFSRLAYWMSCHALLHRIFSTQGLNPYLLRILYWKVDSSLHHLGSPCLQAWKWKWSRSVVSDSATPWTVAYQAPGPWDFPGQNTGVGCHFLLQGIFPTQGSKPGLLHCRQTLYRLSHTCKTKILLFFESIENICENTSENLLLYNS